MGIPRHLSAQGGAQAIVERQEAVGAHHLQRHASHAQLHLLLRLQVHLWGRSAPAQSGPPPRPGPPGPAPLMTPRAKCSRAPRGGGEQAQGASGLLRAPAGTPPHLAPASVPRYHLTRDNTRFPVCPPGPREVLCTQLRGLEAAAVGGGLRPHFIGEETEAGPQQGDSGAPLLSHTHFSGGTKLRGRDVETGRGRWDSARAKATSDGDVLPGPARVG